MKRMQLLGALCPILIAGICFLTLPAGTATSAAQNQQGAGSIYKFDDAGIQFLVPPGWEVQKDKDGTVTVTRQQGVSLVVAALPAEASDLTPGAQFKAASEGVFSDAKKDFKDFKLTVPQNDTQGGMPLISRAFTGKKDGVDMVGSLTIIRAAKPILIFVYATAKDSDDLNQAITRLLGSIKKIE